MSHVVGSDENCSAYVCSMSRCTIADVGGLVRSGSFVGLISYDRSLLCRQSDGVVVGYWI